MRPALAILVLSSLLLALVSGCATPWAQQSALSSPREYSYVPLVQR
jgi:hypothetical protein